MRSNFAMVPFANRRISVSISGRAASIRAIVRRRSEVWYIQIKFSSSTLKFMPQTVKDDAGKLRVRIEDGRMNLQISPQLMDEMIEEALHHVNRKSCEHTITTQYGDEILLVNVDARLIMQVVVNLVDNAIKYTPVGSVIRISAYRKDHQVVVEVADNGPGIPDHAKAQVFEMFYTGQSRIADSHRSLGLGLPLCRAILTAHGGTLTLRDNIPNGSVFSFALPQSEVNIHE